MKSDLAFFRLTFNYTISWKVNELFCHHRNVVHYFLHDTLHRKKMNSLLSLQNCTPRQAKQSLSLDNDSFETWNLTASHALIILCEVMQIHKEKNRAKIFFKGKRNNCICPLSFHRIYLFPVIIIKEFKLWHPRMCDLEEWHDKWLSSTWKMQLEFSLKLLLDLEIPEFCFFMWKEGLITSF